MAILEKETYVVLHNQMISHYENLGYAIPRQKSTDGISRVKRGTKILVRVEDLTQSSSVVLTKICDFCGKKVKTTYVKILRGRKTSDECVDKCKECSDKRKLTNLHKTYSTLNNIAVSHPELVEYFWDKNDPLQYTHQSNKRTDFKCPDCGEKISNKRIQDIYKYGLSCPKCSDSLSYPEKFMFDLLKQLDLEFETQKSFNWIKGKRYDFYIPSINCIIEVHGKQHFDGGYFRSLEEEQKNDRFKKLKAIKSGFKEELYVEIDASRSSLDYIKKSILQNDKLNRLFDVSRIDFLRCHEFSSKSIIKTVGDLSKNGYKVIDISKELKIHRKTVRRYLKVAKELDLCDYEPHSNRFRPIIQLSMDGKFIAEYKNMETAKKITGASNISNACMGKCKSSGGFRWIYKEDYVEYISQV